MLTLTPEIIPWIKETVVGRSRYRGEKALLPV
jgi:hypothetical protein